MYQLNANDIAVALLRSGLTKELEAFERAAVAAAEALAVHHDVEFNAYPGDYGLTQDGFGGLCIPFFPKRADQKLPEAFEGLDSADEWVFFD